MRYFYNMKIGQRLTASFAILLALTTGIGLVGIDNVATLASINDNFHDHPFTVVKNIGQARIALRTLTTMSRDLVLAQNAQQIASAEQAIEQDGQAFSESMTAAKAAFLGDKKDFDRSIAAFTEYRAVVSEIDIEVK